MASWKWKSSLSADSIFNVRRQKRSIFSTYISRMDRNKCVYKDEDENESETLLLLPITRALLHPSVTVMRKPASFLHSTTATTATAPAISIDSDMVIILASLLCALICVAGLALVARCACRRARLRQQLLTTGTIVANGGSPAPRGLKKQAIDALPVVTAAAAGGGDVCAICLADFAAGEELIRVLPHCGHGFHVACIDTWLGAHATCPSCRATIVGSSSPAPPLPDCRRCRTCGATCDNAAAAASARDERSLP